MHKFYPGLFKENAKEKVQSHGESTALPGFIYHDIEK